MPTPADDPAPVRRRRRAWTDRTRPRWTPGDRAPARVTGRAAPAWARRITTVGRRPLRHLVLRRILAVSLLLVAGAGVADAHASAVAERERWGPTARVAVARRAIGADERIGIGDAVVEQVPASLRPDGALARIPVGRRTTAAIGVGEILVGHRLVDQDALTDDGARVAVPQDTDATPVRVGDRVDVVAGVAPDPWPPTKDGAPAAAADGPGSRTVTRDAGVVTVGQDAVTLAVDRSDAETVAAAALDGPVVLVVVG